MSHPTRVRGLKLNGTVRQRIERDVAPHAGAWIETRQQRAIGCHFAQSHPTRVRGLKQTDSYRTLLLCGESHPTRVRGLKPQCSAETLRHGGVAPHAGAWIETELQPFDQGTFWSRTPRGCVD